MSPEAVELFDRVAASVLSEGRVAEMASYVQHGRTTTLDHSMAVAAEALRLSRGLRMDVDEEALIRGAILHDYYLYDWHDGSHAPDRWHGFTHPGHALRNATEDFQDLMDVERDIISHHMFPFVPVPPRSAEGWLVCVADKACAVREILECVSLGRRRL